MQLVLLIETDPYSLKEFESNLSGNRFRLVVTASIKKGLEFARSAPPNLILLGMLQEKDLLDSIIYLKKDPITKLIPILALMHNSNQAFQDHLNKIGIGDILIKPIRKLDLIQKVNELLGVSEKIRANIIKETKNHVSVAQNKDDRIVIVFRSGIKNYVIPEIRNVLNHEFIKSIINKHICIDIRTLPEISLEEMQMLEKILKLFGNKKLSIITGTHLGNIMKNSDISDTINLFLSMDDYELFLENPELDE